MLFRFSDMANNKIKIASSKIDREVSNGYFPAFEKKKNDKVFLCNDMAQVCGNSRKQIFSIKKSLLQL